MNIQKIAQTLHGTYPVPAGYPPHTIEAQHDGVVINLTIVKGGKPHAARLFSNDESDFESPETLIKMIESTMAKISFDDSETATLIENVRRVIGPEAADVIRAIRAGQNRERRKSKRIDKVLQDTAKRCEDLIGRGVTQLSQECQKMLLHAEDQLKFELFNQPVVPAPDPAIVTTNTSAPAPDPTPMVGEPLTGPTVPPDVLKAREEHLDKLYNLFKDRLKNNVATDQAAEIFAQEVIEYAAGQQPMSE